MLTPLAFHHKFQVDPDCQECILLSIEKCKKILEYIFYVHPCLVSKTDGRKQKVCNGTLHTLPTTKPLCSLSIPGCHCCPFISPHREKILSETVKYFTLTLFVCHIYIIGVHSRRRVFEEIHEATPGLLL